MWPVLVTLSALLFCNLLLFSFPTILGYSTNSLALNYHEGSHYRRRVHPPPHLPPHKRPSPPPPPPASFYFFSPPPPSPPCAPKVGQPLYASPPPPRPRPAHHRHRHRHDSPVPWRQELCSSNAWNEVDFNLFSVRQWNIAHDRKKKMKYRKEKPHHLWQYTSLLKA